MDVEELELSYTADGNVKKITSILESRMAVS